MLCSTGATRGTNRLAVRTVAGGGAGLDPAVTSRVLTVYRTASQSDSRVASIAELTARELEVLFQIAKGRTNAEIADQLYVGEGTVKTHINHLFAKLGLRDRSAAIIFAYGHGLTEG